MTQEQLNKKLKFIEDYKKASNAATGSEVDSNANITVRNIATLSYELPKMDCIELQRAFMKKYLIQDFGEDMAKQYEKDLKHHIIYRHDETSGSGGFPYCCAISMYPFLLNGLRGLGGDSVAPKHANSFIGGVINLVFLIAGQFAGAVAIPEFLTYFDHFLRIDYGEDYTEHLDDVIESFGNRKATLRDKIEDWFQQFVHCINAPASARGYQSVFINIGYFDKYYFASIFKDFVFPDGDEPKWETTSKLQKMFIRWFNEERTTAVLTFPVETFSLLTENGQYKDKESADFVSQALAEGHSFFVYQSDSVSSLSSCCRLRSAIEEDVFSTTMGAGGIETGSRGVITLNLNRIIQDWYKEKEKGDLINYITNITSNVHKYLQAFAHKLQDDYDAGLLTVYKAGFIALDKQFLTVGVNGFVEAAEFLATRHDTKYNDIRIDPNNEQYRQLALDILGTIENLNKQHRTEHCKFNLECVPGENCSKKLYDWDKRDGYMVPGGRNLYNSYFYIVEDSTIDPVKKFYYQGHGFADICSGGVALHCNLSEFLSKAQYRHLLDVAIKAGCNYFCFNIPMYACDDRDCGYVSKYRVDKCPKCGATVTPVTRIIGYLKRVSNFSEARQIEASKRFYASKDSVDTKLNEDEEK